MKSHIILFVEDQFSARDFYKEVLDLKPILDVPGMTEFLISENTILGLMPRAGIKRLLGDSIGKPQEYEFPQSELYLMVEHPQYYADRALRLGASLVSPLLPRDWGHMVLYLKTPDGHLLAFADDKV